MIDLFNLTNITAIAVFLSTLGGFLWKFAAFKADLAALAVKITYLEKEVETNALDLQDFERQMLHYLERIDNKLDKMIFNKPLTGI